MKTREEVFNELIESIYEVSRSTSAYESIPRKYGIEDELYMVEAHTINLIGKENKVSPSHLAKLTNKTKGAISQMVDKLLKKGLVIKYKNPTNNREVIIELSDKGKQAYEYHKELDQIEYGRMLSRLNQFSTEDLINFTKIASVINDHVENLIQNK
ncbi:MarR family winged helix-turn-helix transcriptional regulator [Priestia aryabhattai]|uniref:MarR family winged helix-turn-helix transcriptional regulator n=1 Tax=Priestia aryabhattai TaxID=412384 RepID=UPI0024534BD2|nr:MarR family transcriptional regulator [Priestia aryabhattai]MDH3110952.1 MarR family transcriptional regulator [Priestia aryabhattai]MDH3124525.1 MarR family transcriptional regulator [Priestia aryabhattai]